MSTSRLEQPTGGELLSNPAKKFLQFKNYYTKESITVKGKKKEVKVFDKCGFTWAEKIDEEWVNHEVDLPLEFAIINGDWVSFKGWNEEEKTMYYSNEVKDAKSVISIRNKEGIVYEFTLNDMWGKVEGSKVKDEAKSKLVKSKLKALNVKQHSSIYVGMKNDEGNYELVNFQLKGANLSGSKNEDHKPSGWWNVSKALKAAKKIYTYNIQMNDWITEDGELGEYGVVNWTLGDPLTSEQNEELEVLYNDLLKYHEYYTSKNTAAPVAEAVSEPVAEPVAATEEDDELPF